MSRCEIECYAVSYNPSGHLSAHGVSRTEARCKTHHMKIDEPCFAGYLCPIGRIEEATEAAIAELRAELRKMRQ